MLRINQLAGFGNVSGLIRHILYTDSPYFWQDAASATLDGDTHGWQNFNMRHIISSLSYGGDGVRALFQAGDDYDSVYDEVYIGEQASSGDAWDMKSSPTPVQLFLNGSSTIFVSAGTIVATDRSSFHIDSSKTYVIATHFTNLSDNGLRQASGSSNIATCWGSQAASEASTPNVSGYNSPSISRGLKGLQVEQTNIIFSPTVTQ